jgi:hypothetical protein
VSAGFAAASATLARAEHVLSKRRQEALLICRVETRVPQAFAGRQTHLDPIQPPL